MHLNHRSAYRLFSLLIGLALLLSAFQPGSVEAGKTAQDDGLRRGRDPKTGLLTFLGADPAKPHKVPNAMKTGMRGSERSRAILDEFGHEFGLRNAEKDLVVKNEKKEDGRRSTVRYQQVYNDIPVMGGELVVNATEAGELLSISGEVSQVSDLALEPVITADEARAIALQLMQRNYSVDASQFELSEPELWIFDEHLIRDGNRPPELVWRMEAAIAEGPVRETILVDAVDGSIPMSFNQVDMAWGSGDPQSAWIHDYTGENAPSSARTTVAYTDLVVDAPRHKLYGSDKWGDKIDVIDMTTMAVTQSYMLVAGAHPTGLDLSPDGNELAVALADLQRIVFINLTGGVLTQLPSDLTGPATALDVIYGRAGVLYVASTKGLHVVDLVSHQEDPARFFASTLRLQLNLKACQLSSDKNTLYCVTRSSDSGDNLLVKLDVSQELAIPALTSQVGLSNTSYLKDLGLSLVNDNTLLLSAGKIYSASDMLLQAYNSQYRSTVLGIPGRDFYVTVLNKSSEADKLLFFDLATSHQRSWLDTGRAGTPGAVAVTPSGNALFLSSTAGMAKFQIGSTPPGNAVSLPSTRQQYADMVFDLPRQRLYATDVSNNIDVIDLNTSAVLKSYLLPAGSHPTGLDISPDGTELAIALSGLECILFMDPLTGSITARSRSGQAETVYYDYAPNHVVYGRTGRLYANGHNLMDVFDSATHAWISQSVYPYGVRGSTEMAITADRNYLYTNSGTYGISRWDIRTDPPLASGGYGDVAALDFDIAPDGGQVFTRSAWVLSGDLTKKQGLMQLGYGGSVEYVPGRDVVAISEQQGLPGMVSFINAEDYGLITMYLTGLKGNIKEMEASPDGSKLAVNSSAGGFLIIDLTKKYPLGYIPSGVLRSTYTAQASSTLPGKLLCINRIAYCTGGEDQDADSAHQFANSVLKFYLSQHARDSLDAEGMEIESVVHYRENYDNAFWNGKMIIYGDKYGYVRADDLVAHELTHGVTQYESNLFYYYQSGAINESLSDVWGEAYDQLNGKGNDAAAVKWLIGEDITGLGALRSMQNPGQFGDPDRMTSANYYRGWDDNGGVHFNSGVNNKAATLMVDGGSFNGQTVSALGWDKVLAIYYEAQTNLLTSGSDYLDLYNALYQACLNKVGTAAIGPDDCTQVRNATLAVEMDQQPIPGFTPEVGAMCPAGQKPVTIFTDDLEVARDGWTFDYDWRRTTGYATSGTHMLYGDDSRLHNTAAPVTSPLLSLPSDTTSYLSFKHAFGFEAWAYEGVYYLFDGGVLEYSANRSPWTDAGPLFRSGQNYNGVVTKYYGGYNPLSGRKAFVDESHGYVSSQYSLAPLAGQNVRFRWRMGTDIFGYYIGWFIDDIQIYTCLPKPSRPTLLSPADTAKVPDYTPTFDWSNSRPAVDHYQLQVAADSSFTSRVIDEKTLLASEFTPATDLEIGKTYFWRVRAFNALGMTSAWSAPFSFAAVPDKPLLTSPASGELLLNNQPSFDWEDVPGATGYILQIDDTNPLTEPLVMSGTPTDSSYASLIDLPANQTLFWRVRATSDAGNGKWSEIRSFQTANPPGVPDLLAPADTSASTNATPDFDWSDATLPDGTVLDHYLLQVSTSSSFEALVLNESGFTGSGFTPLSDLPAGQTYYWRVRAFNTLGQSSAWSAVWSYSVTP